MKRSFNNLSAKGLHRLFLVTAMSVLLATVFTGCFGGEEQAEQTVPSTQPPLMIETEPATEATEPAETQAEATPNVTVDGKTVTVTGAPVEVRSAVGPDGLVMGKLEVGTQSEILRQVELDGVHWALVREGWICLDNVDLSDLPGDDEDDDISVVPTEDQNDVVAPPRPSQNGAGNQTNLNQKGVITARALNVRSEPSTTAKVTGSLAKGQVVTVLEKRDGWGRIDGGWISLNYVDLGGNNNAGNGNNNNNQNTKPNNTGALAKDGGNALVTTNGLNVRTAPGTDNKAVAAYNYGDRISILEQRDGWGRTETGWVYMDYVYYDGTRTDNAGTGTVTGDTVNVRRGPGTGYVVETTVQAGDTVEVLAQFKIGNTTWGCLSNGWISMDYVRMD